MNSRQDGRGGSVVGFGLGVAMTLAAGVVAYTAPAQAGELRVMAALGDETLKLIEEGPGRTVITINERPVFEERDASVLKLVNALKLEGRWLVLLRLEGMAENCAVKYRVLELAAADPSRNARVSLPFGSCHEATMLDTPDNRLELTMPTGQGDATAAWTYRDGQVVRSR